MWLEGAVPVAVASLHNSMRLLASLIQFDCMPHYLDFSLSFKSGHSSTSSLDPE
jgi:hypothetical protein